MPARSPFTRLCQLAASAKEASRIDLHVHSTASDGAFSPQEVVRRAVEAGLPAVAITDHDTLAGYEQVHDSSGVEVIAGVEITAEFEGRELHLLGYFVDPRAAGLCEALADIRHQRRVRFEAMAGQLRAVGAAVEQSSLDEALAAGNTLGRRHLARILVESKQVGSNYEAFTRYLCRPEITQLPKTRLPVATAIELVHAAGGVSSWAHPASDASAEQVARLRGMGLDALECEYPWAKPAHGRRLRGLADESGLAVTGGTDCHGPTPRQRLIGAKGVSSDELDALRRLKGASR